MEDEMLLNTPARNMAFKISMPHSQAMVPQFLQGQDVVKKPTQVLRKNVHSYFNPNMYEIIRENLKHQISDKLQYRVKEDAQQPPGTTESAYGDLNQSLQSRRGRNQNFNRTAESSPASKPIRHFGHKAGTQLKEEDTIPLNLLKDQLKQDIQSPRVVHSNFNREKRFTDTEPIYSYEMANFSLIDIEHAFKRYNGAPDIDKFSGRKDNFLSPEQMQAIAEKKELELQRIADMQAAKQKAAQAKQDAADSGNGGEPKVTQTLSFEVAEHNVVANMQPMVKEIIIRMKETCAALQN